MTISTESACAIFSGNGAVQIDLCPFRIFQDSDVICSLVNQSTGAMRTLILNTDYTIKGSGDQAGFTLTTLMVIPEGMNLLVQRVIPYTQSSDFTNRQYEDAIDQLAMQIQQILKLTNLSVQLPDGLAPQPPGYLPLPAPGGPLGWSEDGLSLFNASPTVSEAGQLADVNTNDSSSIQASDVSFLQNGIDAIIRTVQDKLCDRVSVKDFGAKGDTTTNDSAAFTAALNSGAKEVLVPAGTYNVGSIAIPASVMLVGDGKNNSVLRPMFTCDAVITMNTGAQIKDLSANGNQISQKCVDIAGDYCRIECVHAQYASVGFNNSGYDTWVLESTSSDNCTYSIYSANRGINCVIHQHESRGLDIYGFYATYADQQPQAIRFDHCLFFGNKYGIWFDKDTFFITISETIIDGCTDTGVHFGDSSPNTAVDYFINSCFIYANSIGVEVGAGCNHFVIRGGTVANGSFANIVVRATTTNRVVCAIIDGVNIGVCGNNSILMDSVEQGVIENCYFTAPPTGLNIAVTNTYTSGTNPAVLVQKNIFTKVNAVSAYNTRVRDCVGMITDNYGTTFMPTGLSSVIVNHGLERIPNWTNATLQGNLGTYWISNITSTQFTMNTSVIASTNVPFSWEVRCD